LKVLLITYYWPPAGGSGVQRWLKFMKYLPEFDIETAVYTAKDPHYAILDDSLLNEIPHGQEVLKGGIWEPNSLLSNLGRTNKGSSAGFLNPKPSIAERMMQYIRANYFIPDARKFWIKPSVKLLSSYLDNNTIDVVITTGPPHSLHLIGLALKKKYGLKWVADFRDPWTNIDYFHNLPLTKRSLKKHYDMETMVLKYADAVLVVGKSMKDEFRDRNSEVHVLTNGFDELKESGKIDLDKRFSMSHIGLMNADRNPIVLWKVLKELADESTEFANDLQVKMIGKCADEVYKSIAESGLKSKVSFEGYVSHHEVLQYQQASQLLLLCVNKVPSAKSVVTGKVFEYLQSNRPILAIGPVDGDLAEILEETNAGKMVDFDDGLTLKNVIKQYYADFKAGKLRVNTQNVDQYQRKNLTGKLAGLLREI
jgi:glycosyltransferase involved in cell wall biosynthesis